MNKVTNEDGLEKRLRELEPAYQSDEERHIGRILDRYGVPFFYKQPVLVYDKDVHQVWHPNFMAFEYNGLIIEYHDIPKGKEIPADIQHRQAIYQANQIPAVFVYPMDLAKPNADEKLYERIKKTYDPDFRNGQLYRQ